MSADIVALPVVRIERYDRDSVEQQQREAGAYYGAMFKRPFRTRPLLVISNCPRCGNTGRVTYDKLRPHERQRAGFGSVSPCPVCVGFYDAQLAAVDHALNAPGDA